MSEPNAVNPVNPSGGASPRWDIEWILSVLPHRYPFQLVNRVLEIEPKKRIVAL